MKNPAILTRHFEKVRSRLLAAQPYDPDAVKRVEYARELVRRGALDQINVNGVLYCVESGAATEYRETARLALDSILRAMQRDTTPARHARLRKLRNELLAPGQRGAAETRWEGVLYRCAYADQTVTATAANQRHGQGSLLSVFDAQETAADQSRVYARVARLRHLKAKISEEAATSAVWDGLRYDAAHGTVAVAPARSSAN
ncbi:hypothetical protein [Saccharopolyspora griseoalba]|uniref:Uncharacterized protein n=1 Tax=Saccharopolyspora griseoalba TaxID=1431848 RepID=A0ABW2LSW0_9PSEU